MEDHMNQGHGRRAGARGHFTRRRTPLAVAAIAAAFAVAPAAPAAAANQVDCSADAVKATVAGQSTLNPVTTARAKCVDSSAGLPNTTDAVALAPAIKAKSAYAITDVTPDGVRPLDTVTSSGAAVENLSLNAGNTIVIGADAVSSFATAKCVNGALELSGGGDAVKLTIGGQPIALDPLLGPLTDAVSDALGVIVKVKLNEQIRDGNTLIQRGAHIQLLPSAGAAPLADVIIAESRVSGQGEPCNPNVPENIDTDGDGVADIDEQGSVGGANTSKACPNGSSFDAVNGVCIIPASASGGQGIVVIGRPFEGPSGGTVISLNVARQLYKNSPCVKGPGPKFAVAGTNGADRITGTNSADRVIARGGNDAVDGGRGNDCLDGGAGKDNVNGAIGNDRVFGLAGNDALNGGPGVDYLSGGSGNDSINAAFGADKVFGGAGNDFINTATAGKPATVSCGSGRDKARVNPDEVRRSKGCETISTFRPKR
ncbi:hypothetical protein C7Y72_07245 [Paraconexibacter algicola]|uniref:Calcium-binding protein n=2 Tax=Paraconexibacter algicola TaxID=2133960 RepID=A0A2T4UJP9_9ACTN|nr:hypothetical protein C7Y72_07245 [Paraconexibacter algicola]